MNVLLKAVQYFAATLMALGVSRLALHLSVKLALSMDAGALFFVSWFLIAGAAVVFVVTFRQTLFWIEAWIKRHEVKRSGGTAGEHGK